MVAVSFERVSKRFTLHHDRPRSFQEAFLSTLRGTGRDQTEPFWVLKDVSFQVARGETVGLIGANGAGKSTALKLITRIIEPTSGRVQVNGRVGALLELGAGFHPDLTGRENIYLNGSILGLSEAQIRCKLDDIIAFAELERFIDVPVKHYSSGMYVRLGFSIAVHSDPEILLVDEVLAVGDYSFQHKCLERIMEMQQQGVTICYVSHDLGTVERLCSQAIWLDDGIVQAAGSVPDTVASYLRAMASQEESRAAAGQASKARSAGAQRRWGSGDAQISSVCFVDSQGAERGVFRVGEAWAVRIRYRTTRRLEKPVFGLAIHGADGVHICGPNTYFSSLDIPFVEGEGEIVYRVDSLPLLEGTYLLSAAIHNQADTVMYDFHDRLHTFRVRQVEKGERYGLVSMPGRWEWSGNSQS